MEEEKVMMRQDKLPILTHAHSPTTSAQFSFNLLVDFKKKQPEEGETLLLGTRSAGPEALS
jgi:hypothetical protein